MYQQLIPSKNKKSPLFLSPRTNCSPEKGKKKLLTCLLRHINCLRKDYWQKVGNLNSYSLKPIIRCADPLKQQRNYLYSFLLYYFLYPKREKKTQNYLCSSFTKSYSFGISTFSFRYSCMHEF